MAGRDARDLAQPVHSVLASTDAVLVGELVSEEPVAEGGVVGVEVVEDIDQVRISPVPVRHR